MKKILVVYISFFCIQSSLYGQTKTISAYEKQISDSIKNSTRILPFSFFYPEEKYTTLTETDTSIQHEFTRFDPTKKRGNDHVTLGNTFSPANSLLYNPRINLVFDHGYHQYDPYALRFDNYRFYTAKKPKSELFFSQFANQLNFAAGAKLAMPFTSGWALSMHFLRVSEQGFYQSHAVKSTNFGMSLFYQSPKDRYSFIFSFIQHAQDEENNGGIAHDSVLIQPQRGAIPTNLIGAKTRHQERSFHLAQYLTIVGNASWKLYLKNTLAYEPSYFKFSHATEAKDTVYYGNYLQDTRGIRRYMDIDHTLASFFIHGENQKGLKGQAGIQFDLFSIQNQGFSDTRRDLSLVFKGDVPFFRTLILRTKGMLGLGNNAGNFNAEGKLTLDIAKWADFSVGTQFFLSEPSYAQQNLILNENIIFSSDFSKNFGTRFFGTLYIPFTKTTISALQSIETRPVYWKMKENPVGMVDIESIQSENILSYTSLRLLQDIRIANIDFNHGVFFQIFSENLYHLPIWYTVHQLYWNPRIFKKQLQLSIGGEARIIPDYKGVGYSVVHGQFFSDEAEFPLFPELDLIVNAKVKTFRVSVMIENAGQWFFPDHNFDVKNYPRMDPLLRFSLKWMFYN